MRRAFALSRRPLLRHLAAITCSPSTHGVPAAKSFAEMGLDGRLETQIRKSGFQAPTSIQSTCVPMLAKKIDVMACGQTGSGKTVMFLLPMIDLLLRQNRSSSASPTAWVIAPTRELAVQIHEQAERLCHGTPLRAALAYGGADVRTQARQLAGSHILVATPGRLQQFVNQRTLDARKVQTLVIDEADRMLDLGFEPQLAAIVRALGPSHDRVSLMCSATFPQEIQRLAARFLRQDYIFVSIGRVGAASPTIEQRLVWSEEGDKRRAVLEALQSNPGAKTLIFCATKTVSPRCRHDPRCRRNCPVLLSHL